MPEVNPDILRWARETAGLTPEEAVRKLSIKKARGTGAIDRLRALEAGEQSPTRAMLSKMANQYRRPLLTFYLAQPPRRGNWGRDYRAPAPDRSARDEALLNALVRDVQVRQGLLRSAMLDDDDEQEPIPFIGAASPATPVDALVTDMRRVLGLGIADLRNAPNQDAAFRLLRSRVERAGVFVLLLGDLGSHHTELSVNVFRGFALTNDFAPFIVVNPKDSPAGRSFTLLHELAHLWLGKPGISGGDPLDPVEVFCNQVASTFLLPDDELDEFERPERDDDVSAWAAAISTFARLRRISSSMVAYRLHRRGAIEKGLWLGLHNLFRRQWQAAQKAETQRRTERGGHPPYGVLVRHRLGPGLVELAFRLEDSGAMSATKVGKVLGIPPRNARVILLGQ